MIGGRYSLDREIGRGGMGAVWLGHDEVLGRPVAVKRVGAAPGVSSPDLVRAEREARIAARVNHPCVVAVFDLVHDEDQKWLVMEYVDGTTLADLIRARGSIDSDELAPLLAQAAEALRASHEVGIVHRDVKPSNILVTHDGRVKLSDFGIARAEADTVLTATGLVTGSPAYISPEVASGRQATPASDVWSLGATAYHALTGSPPYEVRDNVLGTLYRIVHEDPPPTTGGGWVAPFVSAAMTKDPDHRWSMAEAAAFLQSGGTPPRRRAEPVVDAEATQLLTTDLLPAADPGPAPQQPTTAAPAPPAAPGPSASPPGAAALAPGGARRGPRGRHGLVLAVAAAVALLVGLVVLLVALDDESGPSAGTGGEPGSSPSRSASGDRQPTPPTAQEMEEFAVDYVGTAAGDPEAGFALLTPAYQSESGGLAGYEGFWGRVSNTRVDSVEADAEAMTVTYSYRYDLAGEGVQEETIRLDLERAGEGFLIADAVTIG